MYMYLLILVIVTLASWYFVLLLTKVFALAFKKKRIRIARNSEKGMYSVGVCLHLDLRLSPFLFATKSGVCFL